MIRDNFLYECVRVSVDGIEVNDMTNRVGGGWEKGEIKRQRPFSNHK